MKRQITWHNQPISYHSLGKGKTVILLHGFLESKEMWKGFISKLSNKFRVLAIDLPGHGQSGHWSPVHSMEFMAEIIKTVMDEESIPKASLIGHSMGGYVALAFARKYPEALNALGLFHSQAAADSEQAKNNRDRTIAIIKSDRQGFISNFIPDLFAEENVNRFAEEIDILKRQSLKTTQKGMIAALEGMKCLDDYTMLLQKIKVPVLFIAGKKDKRIPLEVIFQQASLPPFAEIHILRNAGHMGYIEEKAYCLRAIESFIEKSFDNGRGKG